MGLKDVEGKRSGRPLGSKSTPRWLRDVRWAYANLGNPDAEPPSELARLLVALGREHPDRLFTCLVLSELLALRADNRNQEAISPPAPTAGTPEAYSPPALESISAETLPEPKSKPAEPPPDSPQNGKQSPRANGKPQRLKTVTLRMVDIVRHLASCRPRLPVYDARVVGSAVDKAREVVVFTVSSGKFPPVADGATIPELEARFAR